MMHPSSTERGGGYPIRLTFNMAKIREGGEDAGPLLHVTDRDNSVVLLGVFDGMGGAGGQSYRTESGTRTGAYIGANQARCVVQRWFDLKGSTVAVENRSASLHEALSASMERKLTEVRGDAPSSRVRSKMIRQLPTTASLLLIEGSLPAVHCHALWAGDSRAYVLAPDGGLGQLTKDHLRESADAQQNLRLDSPMSNCISASDPFSIDSRIVELDNRAILLTATDGCFGYVASPAMFEFILLKTLHEARDVDDWRSRLMQEIGSIAADDASMALIAVGWESLQAMQHDFSSRRSYIDHLVGPIRQAQRRESELRREVEFRRTETSVRIAERRLNNMRAAETRLHAETEVAAAERKLAEIQLQLSKSRHLEARVRLGIEDLALSAAERDEQGIRHAELREAQEAISVHLRALGQAEQDLKAAKDRVENAPPEIVLDPPGEGGERSRLDSTEADVRVSADRVWAIYRDDYERYLQEPVKHRRERTANE